MPSSPEIIAHIDGASRGNPGPAAFGVAVETPQGKSVTRFGRYLGEATNNFAEYQGLLAALDYALGHGYLRLRVVTDSELMARQISGRYKVRSPDLKPLHEKAQAMIARLESFSIHHVLREHNREADRLANKALDDAAAAIAPPTGPHAASLEGPGDTPEETLRAAATFRKGVLKPSKQLSLIDGEEVDLEIRRRK
jgi:ribonuclease HI